MSRPPFQAGLQIDNAYETGTPGVYYVQGRVIDNTLLGYTALDAAVGNYVYIEQWNADVDMFKVTNIISVVGNDLECNVIYNEPGVPGAGGISTGGVGAICEFPDQPPVGDQISDYLLNGIRNLNLKLVTNTFLDIVVAAAPGGTAAFTLNKTPTGIGQIAVFANGVLQPPASYTIVGTALTFTTDVPEGWCIAAMYPVHPYDV